jgi:hypothetical protein
VDSPRSLINVTIIMLLRDDWTSAAQLVRRIDKTVPSDGYRLGIVLVDDGSAQMCERADFPLSLSAVRTIQIIRLRRNLGHQRAIAIGLMHIKETIACDESIFVSLPC